MILCESIDTLAMAYLDDELAAEERRELELHLTDCAGCRAHLDGERAEHDLLQRALAAPPAPELLRARVGRALDAEDVNAVRAERKRWSQWLLPGSAMLAAAAAIAVFVGVQSRSSGTDPVAREAVSVVSRPLPMEVSGPATGPWLRANFSMEVPQVDVPGATELGARLFPHGISGHDGAVRTYRMQMGDKEFGLRIVMIRDLRDGDLTGGDEVTTNGRTLHVIEADGRVVVTELGPEHMGFIFVAPELSTDELVWLASRMSRP
jgi:anti-sigma factor RsiW